MTNAAEATKSATGKSAAEKRKKLVAACVVAILGLALIGAGAYAVLSDNSQQSTAMADENTDTEDLVQAMTIALDELEVSQWETLADGWTLSQNSMTTTDASRVEATGISDAVSFPFTDTTSVETMKQELQKELLTNPIYGIGFIEFLMSVQVGEVTIGDLNPWMETAVEINEDGGIANWIEYGSDGETLVVNQAYREIAVGLATLIDRLVSQGTGTYSTTENWSLNLALKNTERRIEVSGYQYEGEFLVLSYVAKSGDDLLVVGFNLLDKRWALIQEIVVADDGTYVPSTPSTTTIITTTTTTTTTEGDDPDPDPVKDPTKDPESTGNAATGGGVNDNAGSGDYEEEHSSSATGSSAVTGNSSSSSSSNSSNSSSSDATAGSSTTGTGSESAPETEPIEATDGTEATDNGSGESVDLSESVNTGTIAMPD